MWKHAKSCRKSINSFSQRCEGFWIYTSLYHDLVGFIRPAYSRSSPLPFYSGGTFNKTTSLQLHVKKTFTSLCREPEWLIGMRMSGFDVWGNKKKNTNKDKSNCNGESMLFWVVLHFILLYNSDIGKSLLSVLYVQFYITKPKLHICSSLLWNHRNQNKGKRYFEEMKQKNRKLMWILHFQRFKLSSCKELYFRR